MPIISDRYFDHGLQAQILFVGRVCIAAGLAIGAGAYCGWLFGIHWLRRPLLSFAAVNPATAVLLVCGACGLLVRTWGSKVPRSIGTALGAVLIISGATKLLDAGGLPVPAIDQVLFAELINADLLAGMPNRMAPNSAFCFFFLGIALVPLPAGTDSSKAPEQFALLPVALAAMLSTLGYIYGVPHFSGLLGFTPMAPLTAVSLLLLAVGYVASSPARGFLRHFTTTLAGSMVARWLIPATLVAPVILGFVRLMLEKHLMLSPEFGLSIVILSMMTIFALFVWFTTRALNLKDQEQSIVREEMALLNLNLERRVDERTAAVLKTETRLRQVLDAMSEGFQIMGFDLRYLYVNDAVARQAKLPKEVLLRSTFLELFSTSANPELMDAFQRCLKHREAFHMENRFVFPDGSDGWFDLHFQPIPEGLFILSSDITDRKRTEMEILRLNENLEEKVHARTAQLEAVNNELESFSYSVSHDLRAPLRTLTGYIRMLRETTGKALNDEAGRMITVIEKIAARMNQLITDLLAFSQLGTQDLHPATIDMNLLVADAMLELFPEGPPAQLTLNLTKLHPAYGDATLIQQVITNLLSNAIKYSARSEKPIVAIRSVREGDHVIFEIRDNGVGFDMEYADKLFGVFQRLHSSADFEGTGVGLAIVQRIIHKHGGRVWAEAAPGDGARFFFSLPTAEAAKS